MIDMAHDSNDRSSPPFISAIGHFKDLLFKIGGLLFHFYIEFSSNQRSSFSGMLWLMEAMTPFSIRRLRISVTLIPIRLARSATVMALPILMLFLRGLKTCLAVSVCSRTRRSLRRSLLRCLRRGWSSSSL